MTQPALSKLCYRAVEFRATEHSDGRTLEGYAAVFDQATRIDSWEGTFDESIAKGAFKRTLNARKPVLQFDHGRDARTGSVPIGSLAEIREDERGLFVQARMYDNDVVEPIRQAIEGGSIDGMSFRFRVVRDEWRDKNGKNLKGDELLDLLWNPGERGPLQRNIKEVELFELGPVVFPAYDATTVGVRSLLADLTQQEREELVRELANELRQDEPDDESRDDESDDEPVASSDPAERHSDEPEPASSGTSAPIERTEEETDMAEVMSVAERTERQGEIRARLGEIDSEYNGAALPEDVRAEWDSLDQEYEEHERAIQDDAKRKERIRALADVPGATEKVDNSKAGYGQARNAAFHPSRENIYDVSELRNKARSIDELPQLYRDNAMRAVEQAKFPGVKNREEAQGQAERLLETIDDDQGTLARRLLVTGSPLYNRAFGKALLARSTAGLTVEESRAMSLGVNAEGGYAVPFQLDPTVILTSDGSINPLRQVSRIEQIVGKEWQGVTSAGITVTRSPEAQEATDNSPTLAQPTVRPSRVLGFVPFSMELDQDWARLQSEMTRLLADAKDQEEANAFVNGDGVGENPGGIAATLASSSYVGQTGSAGSFTVPDDLFAVEEGLPPRFRSRASWLAAKPIYNQVRNASTGSDGGDLWVRLGAGQPNELIGYPAREQSEMDSVIESSGGGNNLIMLFGDYQTGFMIVDRIGMSVELVPQVFGATNNFPTGQRGIVAMWRNSSVVLADNAIRALNVVSPV